MVTTVDEYIGATSGIVRQTIEAARALVREIAPQAEEVMKWGAPIYLAPDGTPEVYLYAGRDHVNVGFIHGALLNDPGRLLQGKGKDGRHVTFRSPEELCDPKVTELVSQTLSVSKH